MDEADFSKIRYFKRCHTDNAVDDKEIQDISQVKSLRNFRPKKLVEGSESIKDEDTLKFLRRYLKLTHCDLFFADAVILVEGGVEKLLMPEMIKKASPNLKRLYMTVLEVGGAYAHRFVSLVEFIGIPYLIITDLDSVDPAENNKACIANLPNALTSNASIKQFFDDEVSKLIEMEDSNIETNGYICFQKPVVIEEGGELHARTFEESFVYDNLELFHSGELNIGVNLGAEVPLPEQNKAVFDRVNSPNFKKMDFALEVAESSVDWQCPEYISKGLIWLESKAGVQSTNEDGNQ